MPGLQQQELRKGQAQGKDPRCSSENNISASRGFRCLRAAWAGLCVTARWHRTPGTSNSRAGSSQQLGALLRVPARRPRQGCLSLPHQQTLFITLKKPSKLNSVPSTNAPWSSWNYKVSLESFSGIHFHAGLPSSGQSHRQFLYDRKKGRMSSQLRFYALSSCHFRLFSIAFL